MTIATVASELQTSRSQIQRALAEDGLSFSAELREARLLRAAEYLIDERTSVTDAAARVGVSVDHLRVMFKDAWGIAPGRLRRVVELMRRIDRWKQGVPPEYGSRGYWAERHRWLKAEAEVRRLLTAVHPGTPLAAWAGNELRRAKRPDHRRKPHRARVEAERRHQRDEKLRRFQEAVRFAEALMRR